MKTTKQYRQGDVLIEVLPAGQIPKGVTAKKQKRLILAHGEVTGHAHELDAKAGLLSDAVPGDRFRVSGDADDRRGLTCMALIVTTPTKVTHQEHGVIPLEVDEHRVTRQREYSPENIRNVAD